MIHVRKKLSTKLSLGIILLAMPFFVAALGVLFIQSRHIVRNEAVGRAESTLNTTMLRLRRHMNTVETATNSNTWYVQQHVQPDSLFDLTQRIVRLNPHIDGCSFSAEPNIFPERGRYFSVYSVRQADTITTVFEKQYEYFQKIWYKTPHDLDGPCWEVYYDDSDSLELTIDGMVASYGRPVYRNDDTRTELLGIISTDLSLIALSKVITAEKPYPNSYFVMIDGDGRYIIHPDSTRLFTQDIFSGKDPRRQSDAIALGHEMTAGRQGTMAVDIDGEPCLVCYQPVPGTRWSLALISPDSDILQGYYRLAYIVIPLLVIGLIVILLLSYRTVAHTIRPLNRLLEQTQNIASGNYEIHIPRSDREDAVGRLQNSFATMLQSLNFHMGSVRYSAELAERRNAELVKATEMARDADRQKTAFIQNVSHQIRTPLNIIMGFAQVLSDSGTLPEDEMKSITNMMDYNSKLLNRQVAMLFDSSDTGLSEELKSKKTDMVPCNDVAREAVSYINMRYPELKISMQTDVADDFCVRTNRSYLMRSLREILYNSAKYSDGKHITMRVAAAKSVLNTSSEEGGGMVRFVVEDTGKGIAEADRDLIFNFFSKVDDMSEGLGLGLPLAKRHAQNLGGDLTLDANYKGGCRFILSIPYRR